MTIGAWLVETMVKLQNAGVDSPRRDALVLLEDTIHKDRAWVAAHPEYKLGTEALETVNKIVERRLKREPLAYIRGKAWFYGRFFEVNERVLIPRPESENFIELLKGLGTEDWGLGTIMDIGTGSGALAIAAALELPDAKVIATDISSEALKLAQKNAQTHCTDINFLHGSLLEPVADMHFEHITVVANLPYVPEDLITSPEITHEPPEALFSGTDGLDHYREFWEQLADLPSKPEHILTESLESQHAAMETLAAAAGYRLQKSDILIQLFEHQP